MGSVFDTAVAHVFAGWLLHHTALARCRSSHDGKVQDLWADRVGRHVYDACTEGSTKGRGDQGSTVGQGEESTSFVAC